MTHGPLGIHLSVGQKYDVAVAEAKSLGITCAQLFTHSPRGWAFAPLDEAAVKKFRDDLRRLGVSPVASHCNYLINLGTQDREIREKSLACLEQEFAYAHAFGCAFFVLHVGKHKEESLEQGIRNVAEGIKAIAATMLRYPDVTLLLETVAGQGSEIGRDFAELGKVFALLDPMIRGKVGVCVDTCHVFAAGYDIRTHDGVHHLVVELEREVGAGRLKLIHLNDALKELGSRVDRHAHIGEGFIGEGGFAAFLNHPKIAPIPKILETPVDEERGYAENLAVIRKLQR